MSDAAIPKTGRERENSANTESDKKPEGPLQTDHGTTTIEENVVAKIAGMAARQVPGVYDMGNAVRRAFSAVTDRIPTGQANVTGGISVHKGETQAGYSILDVCNSIRDNVIQQVEGTTGLEVVEVNIDVTDIHLPDDASSNSESTDLK